MASLFTSIDCPPQLEEFVRNTPDLNGVEAALYALEYRKGTPGWCAVVEPQTPLDKAFQIYSLNLALKNDFGPEPPPDYRNNERRWKYRDEAWKQAANWIVANTNIISRQAKDKQKEMTKLLPEALRIQCSHELTPGELTLFPKDTSRQFKQELMHTLTDCLQHLGLNIKIKAAMDALDEKANLTSTAELKDFGKLESLIAMKPSSDKEQQLGLF